MKRIILLAAALSALFLIPATAQAAPTATCTEHVTAPYIDWNGPGTGDDTIVGTGFITCTANTGPIDVNTRLIKDGVLQPIGMRTCSFTDYCQKLVYSSLSIAGPSCWKTRAWGYIGPDNNPTGATTSTEFCWP